jgi:hypothetical protein
MKERLISIILPAYREEKNISFIYTDLKKVLKDVS